MAPKKPPAGGGGAKVKGALESYNCATMGVVTVFCLILLTLWALTLYLNEKAKRDPLRTAVSHMRRYLASKDKIFASFNDTNVILEAEKVSRQLIPWATKINELEAEIADLHYKLNHDWTAFKGFLYFFSYEELTFFSMLYECKKFKAHIISIGSKAEEEFLEGILQNKYGPYWIGLRWSPEQNNWKWADDDLRYNAEYWSPGYPKKSTSMLCVKMWSECNTTLKCWANYNCDVRGRGICKQLPEKKWMT
ncbi:CD209 antigen-like protein C isoform 1-T2 [Liasis olivaceus]